MDITNDLFNSLLLLFIAFRVRRRSKPPKMDRKKAIEIVMEDKEKQEDKTALEWDSL